jgi:hypothetical protein
MGQPRAAKKEAGLKVKLVNQVMVTSNTSTNLTSLEKKVIPKKMKNSKSPLTSSGYVWMVVFRQPSGK